MSKISEQKALEAYPIAYYRNGGGIDDANASDRAVYEEGYDQAMQDFLEKAEKFISKKVQDYVLVDEEEYIVDFDKEECINDFKNYIQNESN